MPKPKLDPVTQALLQAQLLMGAFQLPFEPPFVRRTKGLNVVPPTTPMPGSRSTQLPSNILLRLLTLLGLRQRPTPSFPQFEPNPSLEGGVLGPRPEEAELSLAAEQLLMQDPSAILRLQGQTIAPPPGASLPGRRPFPPTPTLAAPTPTPAEPGQALAPRGFPLAPIPANQDPILLRALQQAQAGSASIRASATSPTGEGITQRGLPLGGEISPFRAGLNLAAPELGMQVGPFGTSREQEFDLNLPPDVVPLPPAARGQATMGQTPERASLFGGLHPIEKIGLLLSTLGSIGTGQNPALEMFVLQKQFQLRQEQKEQERSEKAITRQVEFGLQALKSRNRVVREQGLRSLQKAGLIDIDSTKISQLAKEEMDLKDVIQRVAGGLDTSDLDQDVVRHIQEGLSNPLTAAVLSKIGGFDSPLELFTKANEAKISEIKAEALQRVEGGTATEMDEILAGVREKEKTPDTPRELASRILLQAVKENRAPTPRELTLASQILAVEMATDRKSLDQLMTEFVEGWVRKGIISEAEAIQLATELRNVLSPEASMLYGVLEQARQKAEAEGAPSKLPPLTRTPALSKVEERLKEPELLKQADILIRGIVEKEGVDPLQKMTELERRALEIEESSKISPELKQKIIKRLELAREELRKQHRQKLPTLPKR